MLSRRERDFIAGAIGLTLLFGTLGGMCAAEAIKHNNETKLVMSSEVGFDVINVKGAELSQVNEDFKAIIRCTHKEIKTPIVIEYKLTATDFIVMNQPDYDEWHYLSTYIIPNQDPSFVGTEQEYKEYSSNSSKSAILPPELQ